jgi:predicted alpha/beta superfamily hydrolase
MSAQGAEGEREAAPIILGQSYALVSEVYGTEREINVYAPEKPDWAEGPLPVLFVVDGGQEQDFIHLAGLSQLTLVNGERVPMIVVGVRTEDRYGEITPNPLDERFIAEFEGYGGAEGFRRHLTEEVVPFIEARFETGRHVLTGESLAGLFVLDTVLREPAGFDDYIAVSPSLWWDDRRLARETATLLEGWQAEDKRLYLTMADEGGAMQRGLDEVLAAIETASPQGLELRYVDRRGEDSHATIYHGAVRDALQGMFGYPPHEQGPQPWWNEVSD